ncbi:Ca2+-binding protein 1 [Forsythia ovata]|uniref:Ca2+-binding protein 1 n=1 Tax=Forsythia ovata TaxID=205694 RepID=A0ABD1PK02_9LAMI
MCPTGSQWRPETAGKSNIRSAFDVLDADHDGKISYDDLQSLYRGFSVDGALEEDVIGSMISMADANKDGYVEFEEFERVLEHTRRGRNERRGVNVMEEAFRVMDKDGDGRVGYEDLKSYLMCAGFDAVDDDDVKAMIRMGGGDENGGVTFQGLLKILAV